MSKATAIGFAWVLAVSAAGQNLIPNPGFELIDSCPQYPALLGFQPGARPQDWFSFSDTPDYFTACSNDSLNGVPSNLVGWQPAYDGEAYVGFYSYLIDDYREMIGAQLTEPLVVGQTYYASCCFSPTVADQYANLATNRVGMLFSTFPVFSGQGLPGYPLVNQASIQATTFVSDTANWILISGSFVANAAYSYVVIGNFFDNAHTDTLSILTGQYPAAYCYVDHVCLSSTPGFCETTTTLSEGLRTQGAFTHFDPASNSITWSGTFTQAPIDVQLFDPTGRLLFATTSLPQQDRLVVRIPEELNGLCVWRLMDGATTRSRSIVLCR